MSEQQWSAKKKAILSSLGLILAFLLALALLPSIIASPKQKDQFVIKITNQSKTPMRDIQLTGIGSLGTITSLKPGETKSITIEMSILADDINFSWKNAAGSTQSSGHPNEWNKGSDVSNTLFHVTKTENEHIQFENEELPFNLSTFRFW